MCFFIFFSKDWKPTTFVTMFQAVPKKKRTKENKMKKNEKEKTITKKKKSSVVLVYLRHTTQVLQKEEKLKGFIHHLLIQVYTKYNRLSLSYISSTSTESVPNKYISKPSKPKRLV